MLLVSNVFTWSKPKSSAAIPSGLPGLIGPIKGSVAKVETGIEAMAARPSTSLAGSVEPAYAAETAATARARLAMRDSIADLDIELLLDCVGFSRCVGGSLA